jgi:putative transposase
MGTLCFAHPTAPGGSFAGDAPCLAEARWGFFMTDYRRAFVTGGCYFFTVVTQDRRPLFADAESVARLREGFRRVKAAHPFEIDAVAILPDHLHVVWRLPEGDADYPLRWRKIKHYFSVGMDPGAERASLSRRREKGVWQRRYWEHVVRDELDWQRHVDYVHFNPVKHGYVVRPGDWPYSSFSHAVAAGWYPAGWVERTPTSLDAAEGEWGE